MKSIALRIVTAVGIAGCLAANAVAQGTPTILATGNVLAAGNYNDGTGSSDITLIIQLEAGGSVIFDEGADVMYHIPTADVDGWTLPAFDDSGWEAGISSVGYNDGDDNTEVPNGANSIYTRYHFDIPGAQDISSITLRIDYDDSYILWLNGVEIARSANIATLSAAPEIPAWDVSKTVDSMPDVEATKFPAGKPNSDRWGATVTPFDQDVHETIHEIQVAVEFGSASAVKANGKLAAVWADLRK